MLKLDAEIKSLESYLKNQGWLEEGETVKTCEIPGEGNMNFTLRIITNLRRFIIKQSREYVEKYPSVAAPQERVQREAEFYGLISSKPTLRNMMPRLMDLDPVNNVMIMEDLGTGTDFTYLYHENEILQKNDLDQLTGYLTKLHSSIYRDNAIQYISNKEMRKLNHEHIFVYPYLEDNGLDLDTILPGLQKVAHKVKVHKQLIKTLGDLGEIYLEDGKHLLHGDYFPGSWLNTADGIKIIDPEFCFFGPVEFEIGVMIAHLKMADQPDNIVQSALESYGSKIDFDTGLQRRFTSTEVLRRILGLAQLPLTIGLERRKELVEEAVEMSVR